MSLNDTYNFIIQTFHGLGRFGFGLDSGFSIRLFALFAPFLDVLGLNQKRIADPSVRLISLAMT